MTRTRRRRTFALNLATFFRARVPSPSPIIENANEIWFPREERKEKWRERKKQTRKFHFSLTRPHNFTGEIELGPQRRPEPPRASQLVHIVSFSLSSFLLPFVPFAQNRLLIRKWSLISIKDPHGIWLNGVPRAEALTTSLSVVYVD